MGLVLLLIASPVFARAAEAPPVNDVQNVVILVDERPVFVRFHIQIGDRDFRGVWIDYLNRLFTYLDQNGDGVLADMEAIRSDDWIERIRMSVVVNPNLAASLPEATAEAPPDPEADPAARKITRDDWLGTLAAHGDAPQVSMQGASPTDGSPLAGFLDTDSNGDFSRDELASVRGSLGKLDFDLDEAIGLSELRPYDTSAVFGVQTFAGPVAAASADTDAPQVVVLAPGILAATAEQIVNRYDKSPSDQSLAPEELAIEPAAFDAADANDDRLLNQEELAEFLRDPTPDLVIAARMAMPMPGEPPLKLVELDGRPAPLASRVAVNPDGGLILTLEKIQIAFPVPLGGQTPNYDEFYKQQFDATDADNNLYLEPNEVRQSPYFSQFFGQMDADADGKVFETEALPYLARQGELASSRTQFVTLDRGRLLFDLLDVNHDSRLSLREQREAADRIAARDRQGDGILNADEIPRQFTITISQGPSAGQAGVFAAPVAYAMPGGPVQTAAPSAPRWFLKMDKNADGDVSPREFLGPPEDFARLDENKDGLLSADEAS